METLTSVVLWPAEVLKARAKPITEFDISLTQLVDDMFQACEVHNGMGLSAPQLDVSRRVFITLIDGEKKVYVNPTVKPQGQWELQPEGCLSVPGFTAKVNRRVQSQVHAYDLAGQEFTELLTGKAARCVQHEADHLDGIMFFDHLKIRQRNNLLFEYKLSFEDNQ